MKKASAILASDFHIRETTPECRTEPEFQEAQWGKLDFISDLQKEHDCPVLHGGDLFHHWKPSPWLISKTIKHLPNQFYTIYGQHDLPAHSLQDQDKSGIYALAAAKALTILPGAHWGQDPEEPSIRMHTTTGALTVSKLIEQRKILVWHKMNYQGQKPYPGCVDPRAGGILRKYSQFNLILTGDNHKPFVEEHGSKILVNPGSLMRQSADQIDHKPRVYLYYADENRVEPVFIPIKADVVSRTHIERNEQRDGRIGAFIDRVDGDWVAGMSFESNLEEFLKINQIRTSVKDIIYKAIET